jgi:hypothetical protein
VGSAYRFNDYKGLSCQADRLPLVDPEPKSISVRGKAEVRRAAESAASVENDPYATSAILHSASNRRPSGASSGAGSRDYREMKKPRSSLSWQTQHTQRLRERSPERLLAIDAG